MHAKQICNLSQNHEQVFCTTSIIETLVYILVIIFIELIKILPLKSAIEKRLRLDENPTPP